MEAIEDRRIRFNSFGDRPWFVHVSAKARSALGELAHEHRERACLLVGTVDHTRIYVESCGTIFEGTAREVRIDTDYREQLAESNARAGFTIVGHAHTHPTYRTTDPNPSQGDLQHWAAAVEIHGHPYVGIILAPSTPSTANLDCDPWRSPRRAAWVAHLDGSDVRVDDAELYLEPYA
jgi:hypothetical protein